MAVNRELRLTVENDEHLFAPIVKVVADSALGLNNASVQEKEVLGGHQTGQAVAVPAVEQAHVVQLARSAVNRRRRPIQGRVSVCNALSHRQAGGL